jgi:hypothetical protein
VTTVIPFRPSNIKAPSFTANLDGADYTCIATWNLAAQRYYLNVYDLDNNWIITVPIFASPPGDPVDVISYNPLSGLVTVTRRYAFRHRPGTIIRYTLSGFQPNTYNGLFRCLILDDLSFSFPVQTDPGQATVLGTVNRILNMVAGLFQFSTLIYRNNCFEISP